MPVNYWWNSGQWKGGSSMTVDMKPTRAGFGACLDAYGDDERIVTVHADISNSIKISDFEANHPERNNRVISVGIAEQNMMTIAAGMALEGKIPITGTYGVFASGRPWDQLRTTVCYDNLNVKIAGAHGGVSVGPDGATHQALEEISLMSVLPNLHLVVPCDSVETKRLSKISILDVHGPVYLRFAREATPVVTDETTPLEFGKANVIRYRGPNDRFKDAFETTLASAYTGENEQIAFIACGPMVPEAMRAAVILKEEYGIETRILNIHTVKPIDRAAIMTAADETGAVLTCEEHQRGGFGNIIASVISCEKDYKTSFVFDMIGVEDRFGDSGGPWELMVRFKLTAEHIVQKAQNLLQRREQ
jgi:transketolase